MTAAVSDKLGLRNRKVWLGVTFALVCAAVSLFNWGKLSGREYGYFYGVFETPRGSIPSSGDGPNHFSSMNVWYFSILCTLAAYILAFFVAKWRASGILRIAILCVSLFPFLNMLLYKTETYGIDLPYYHYDGLKASYFLDWMCVALILASMTVEVMIFRSRSSQT